MAIRNLFNLSPSADPELAEALDRKHTHGRWTVPLASGKIAVFAHPMGSLAYAICDTWDEALTVHVPEYKRDHPPAYTFNPAPRAARPRAAMSDSELEDFLND